MNNLLHIQYIHAPIPVDIRCCPPILGAQDVCDAALNVHGIDQTIRIDISCGSPLVSQRMRVPVGSVIGCPGVGGRAMIKRASDWCCWLCSYMGDINFSAGLLRSPVGYTRRTGGRTIGKGSTTHSSRPNKIKFVIVVL